VLYTVENLPLSLSLSLSLSLLLVSLSPSRYFSVVTVFFPSSSFFSSRAVEIRSLFRGILPDVSRGISYPRNRRYTPGAVAMALEEGRNEYRRCPSRIIILLWDNKRGYGHRYLVRNCTFTSSPLLQRLVISVDAIAKYLIYIR